MSRASRVLIAAAVLLLVGSSGAGAQDFPRGTIVDDVKCAADASQSYALYLPSAYSPDRPWNLLVAFPATRLSAARPGGSYARSRQAPVTASQALPA